MKENEFDMSEEASSVMFRQVMDIWVIPEIKRRQDLGELKSPLNIQSAQVIFFPDDERKTQVRINSEIKGTIKVKPKPGFSKKNGEPVFSNEIESIENFSLSKDDDPDCGHITLLRINNDWSIYFDLRYNKALSIKHMEAAEQFYQSAEYSFDKKNWNSFADNLFSAAELSAKALLLSIRDPEFRRKTSHGAIQAKFNKFAHLGNIKAEYRDTFNKLSDLRNTGRYLRGDIQFSEDEARKLLIIVGSMIKVTKAHSNQVFLNIAPQKELP